MRSSFRFLRVCTAVALTLLGVSSASAQSSVVANAPVKNFRLPTFDDAGNRVLLIRGGEARYISHSQIDILDLNFTQFAGDGSTDTVNLLLAPSATLNISGKGRYLVSGKEGVRLISKSADVTGEDWSYDHEENKKLGRLILRQNVRVVIRAPIKGILN